MNNICLSKEKLFFLALSWAGTEAQVERVRIALSPAGGDDSKTALFLLRGGWISVQHGQVSWVAQGPCQSYRIGPFIYKHHFPEAWYMRT
jgi:hypothetical protein